eukprot:6322981-Pyramimonas_sp.AAC.1
MGIWVRVVGPWGTLPVRAGTPMRQHAPTALSDPPYGYGCVLLVRHKRGQKSTLESSRHEP